MTELEKRFIEARTAAIAAEYKNLNPMQRQGVLATQGPLLLLAGAGSGKTTVLIHRIANLLRFGRGSDTEELTVPVSEDAAELLEQYAQSPREEMRPLMEYLCAVEPARPWEILAITFTNKAANELKERLERMLGPAGVIAAAVDAVPTVVGAGVGHQYLQQGDAPPVRRKAVAAAGDGGGGIAHLSRHEAPAHTAGGTRRIILGGVGEDLQLLQKVHGLYRAAAPAGLLHPLHKAHDIDGYGGGAENDDDIGYS